MTGIVIAVTTPDAVSVSLADGTGVRSAYVVAGTVTLTQFHLTALSASGQPFQGQPFGGLGASCFVAQPAV